MSTKSLHLHCERFLINYVTINNFLYLEKRLVCRFSSGVIQMITLKHKMHLNSWRNTHWPCFCILSS